MKRTLLLFLIIFISSSVFAQSPELMSYQAVIRNSAGVLVANSPVGMRISILHKTETGNSVYIETHSGTTNANGLLTIKIGSGTVVSGNISTIEWSDGPYFLQTETDPNGGTAYSTITNVSQILSVPYALHAKTAESITGSPTLTIGQSYQGGKIFWLDTTGLHGLIAATADQGKGIQWYNGTYTVTNAVRDGIGAGKFNTERIIANQGAGAYAAQICANYQGGNYGDWYLPSKYELNLLYLQKTVVGGFSNNGYWSSTEFDNGNAWQQYFDGGYQNDNGKSLPYYVRAVRAF